MARRVLFTRIFVKGVGGGGGDDDDVGTGLEWLLVSRFALLLILFWVLSFCSIGRIV
jgi:hypothetical protein